MIVYVLLFFLFASFTVHILALILYFNSKSMRHFYLFISTTFSDIIIGMILSVVAMKDPELIRGVDLKIVLWLFSGMIMAVMFGIQIYITVAIIKRARDPKHFHLNYFGKKVYEVDVVKKSEIAAMVISMPFFLMSGAYFLVKLMVIIGT